MTRLAALAVATAVAQGAGSFLAATGAEAQAVYCVDASGDVINPPGVEGPAAVACGEDSKASDEGGVAVGYTATAIGINSMALGAVSRAEGNRATAVGAGSDADGNGSLAVGWVAKAASDRAIAIGYSSEAAAVESMALGFNANASGGNDVALGTSANVQAVDAIAVGHSATVGSGALSGVAIGSNATVADSATSAMAFGMEASASGGASTAIGAGASASATGALAIGGNNVAGGGGAQASMANAIAIGGQSVAAGTSAVAIGVLAQSNGANGIAIGAATGANSAAANLDSIAVGYSSGRNVTGDRNAAFGANAGQYVTGSSNLALGNRAGSGSFVTPLTASNTVSVGASALANADNAAAIGRQAAASGQQSLAVGYNAQATSTDAVAIGNSAAASALNTVAIGNLALAGSDDAIAMGHGARANGVKSISIGTGNVVNGDRSGAIGDPSVINGSDSYSVGNSNTVSGNSVFVLGNNVDINVNNAVALGSGSDVTVAGGVAIGLNSVASTNSNVTGLNPATGLASSLATATWKSTLAAVSVGVGTTATRQITGVAAGLADTDAANVAQLKAAQTHYYSAKSTNTAAGSNFANDGATGTDSVAIGVSAKAQATDTIALGSGATATVAGGVALGSNAVTAAAVGTSSATLGGLTYSGFAGTTPVSTVSVGGVGAERTITNVAAGRISATSTDAINGSQLFSVANTLSGQLTHYYSVNSTGGGNENNDGATGTNAIAIGKDAAAMGTGDFYAGAGAGAGGLATNENNVGVGALAGSSVAGWRNTATGYATGSTVTGDYNTANGALSGNEVTGSANAVIGFNAGNQVSGSYNVAMGSGAGGGITASHTVAIGTDAIATADGAIALGGDAQASHAGSVAIGLSSVADGTTLGSLAYLVGGTATGEVNIGGRRITGVSAGAMDTDAVNVAQLKSVSTSVDDLGDRAVKYDGAVGDPKDTITLEGASGTTITNVADGDISAASSDAVNGSQLYATNQQVDQNTTNITDLDGRVTTVEGDVVNLGDTITNIAGDTSTIYTDANGIGIRYARTNEAGFVAGDSHAQGAASTALGYEAKAAADDSVALGREALASHVGSVAIGANSVADGTTLGSLAYLVGDTATGEVSVGDAANSLTRRITGVSAGAMDTDAVNVSQLKAVTTSVDDLGDRAVKYDGAVGDPKDTITLEGASGTTITNVADGDISAASSDAVNGSQLYATNQQVETNTTNITNLDGRVTTVEGDVVNLGDTITNIAGDTSTIYTDANGIGIRYARTNEAGFVAGDSHAQGAASTALGYEAKAAADDSVALGREALASHVGSVAIGANSVADGTTLGSLAYLVGDTATGEVSVGDAANSLTRRITGVSAGAMDTDAVNVSQLKAVTTSVDDLGDRAVKYDGSVGDPKDTITLEGASGTTITNVADGDISAASSDAVNGSQLYATNQQVETNTTNITNLDGRVTTVEGDVVNLGDTITNIAGDTSTTYTDANGIGIRYARTNDAGFVAGDSHAQGAASTALGYEAKAAADDSVALGREALASHVGSVAIGANSVADGTTLGSLAYLVGDTATGEVSVGDAANSLTRRITGVSAGAMDTDAVNVSQLKAVATSVDDLGDRAVKYDGAVGDPKDTITLEGASGTTITNVADGDISAASSDAVNGSQLYATNQQVETNTTNITNLDGRVTTVEGDITNINTVIGDVVGPIENTYVTNNGRGVRYARTNDVGLTLDDAHASAKGSTAVGYNSQSMAERSLSLGFNSMALGAGDVAIGAGAVADGAIGTSGITLRGTSYAFAGASPVATVSLGTAGAERTITNLAAGRISGDSTDAVNGSQLFATNTALDNLSTTVAASKTKYYSVNSTGGGNLNNDGASGADAIASGRNASATATNAVSMGNGAKATAAGGVALGSGAVASTAAGVAGYVDSGASAEQKAAVAATKGTLGALSIGDAAKGQFRQITGVAAGTVDSDAVNVSQLKSVSSELAGKIDGAVIYDKASDGSKGQSVTLVGGKIGQPVIVRNVAEGKADTDAVNVAQLTKSLDETLIDARTYTDNSSKTTLAQANNYTDEKFGQLSGEIAGVKSEARQAAAIGLAAASLRYDDRPGKLSAAIGGGLWRGETGFAFGAGYTNEDGRIRANLSATTGDGHWGGGAGLSFTFN